MHPRRLIAFIACGLASVTCGCGARYTDRCATRSGFEELPTAKRQRPSRPGVVYLRAPTNRAELIETIHAVAAAHRDAPLDQPMDIEVDLPLHLFDGVSCEEIFTPFGRPEYCDEATMGAEISFYQLPAYWIGGGPELVLHFDEDGYCDGAHWCFTQ